MRSTVQVGLLAAYLPNQTAYAVVGWPAEEPMSFGTVLSLAGMINVSPHSTLFIHSTDFGGMGGSLGPDGSHPLWRIVIDKPFGSTVHDLHGTMVDYVNCSNQQLQTLSFSLRDVYGNLVDLKGHNFSFSICLVEKTFL